MNSLQLDSSLNQKSRNEWKHQLIEGMNDFALYRYNYVCDLFGFLEGSKDMEGNIEKEVKRLSLPKQRVCEDCSKVFVVSQRG